MDGPVTKVFLVNFLVLAVTARLLSSFLSRKTEGEFCLQRLRHHLQDLTSCSTVLQLSLCRAVLTATTSIFGLDPGFVDLLNSRVSVELLRAPIPRKGSGSAIMLYQIK